MQISKENTIDNISSIYVYRVCVFVLTESGSGGDVSTGIL